MIILLSAGAACALVAVFICMHMKDRDRMQQSAALFVTMLGLLLAQVVPQAGLAFGGVAIVAALVYVFLAFRSMNRQKNEKDDS